jgi:antitoxin YefM
MRTAELKPWGWQNVHKSVRFGSAPEVSMRTLSITNARKEFLDLPEAIQDEPLFITKHGRSVMALVSIEQFEGMLETIAVLSDPIFTKRLRKSRAQAKAGKTVSLNEAVSRLGL